MTPDVEEGPDPNDIRRHAKKMLTGIQYRQKYRRIDFYKPNAKQIEFHNLIADEAMLRAGNQQGKTHCCAAQLTFDALGDYPGWYEGRKFLVPPKIERPFDFLGWMACTTSVKTRDGGQIKLLGDFRQQGGLGTGLIPLDNIVGRPTMARGISDFVDTVVIRREVNAAQRALIRFKTYEMGRDAFQGEPVDVVWNDEDPGDKGGEIWDECLARLTTTKGRIIYSSTPLLGVTPVRRRFKEKLPGTAEVNMTIDDAEHIPLEERAKIIARYGSRAATRAYGADAQGEGAVFEIAEEDIKFAVDPASFPPYWRWMWALDFSHGGLSASAHPFAAVLCAYDPDTDTIYIVHTIRMPRALTPTHVAAVKAHPMWPAPVAWPHDGGQRSNAESGETYSKLYKRLGLSMRPTHATFADGGYSFENGITEMEERLASKRLKVLPHLAEWFDEYRQYHRKDGLVVKLDDDLLSATRVACMDIRFAKKQDDWPQFSRAALGSPANLAVGLDFDVHA
jgi:phage terminase large subunit-like protein